MFLFNCWRNKFSAFFFQKIRKLTVLIFCYLTANNQLKCGIIYKNFLMPLDDDEQIIMNGVKSKSYQLNIGQTLVKHWFKVSVKHQLILVCFYVSVLI